ncbi:MAG: hypothetical protein IPL71_07835 [Anaerolineales bacterium]|uniref:hypothetical protein n=1 Tax=Candidatus Villigracilis proximus TaxID=3140683 RepID=UPI003135633D|nr:hypothetical protein [Anaerolineales bacterium]
MTIFSALSTFVLTRAARSQLNRVVFGLMRRIFEFILRFTNTYEQRDQIMAYYSPISLIMLVPVWYALIMLGYAAMYWSLDVGDWFADIRYSGSSLLTLGFATSENPFVTILSFSEALIGLILVALLMAYLPTMYAAFSRREQAVSMLEVRAGNPPSALEMLLRFNRIHGLDKLNEYWKTWEIWFADIEESHTTLPALVFFRSPRSDNSWITAAGAVLDAAAITVSAVDIPADVSASLSIRAGYLALRRIADYFDIPNPQNPNYPNDPISITREEFDELLSKLEVAGVPLKADREKAWLDFAGWRVNYDRVLLVLCKLVMAPQAPWSSDRVQRFKMPPMFIFKKKHKAPQRTWP